MSQPVTVTLTVEQVDVLLSASLAASSAWQNSRTALDRLNAATLVLLKGQEFAKRQAWAGEFEAAGELWNVGELEGHIRAGNTVLLDEIDFIKPDSIERYRENQ